MNTQIINVPSSNGGNGVKAPIGFSKREGGTITDVHNQWKSRPADEAVYTVEELVKRTHATQAASKEIENIPWSSLKIVGDNATGGLQLSRGGNGALAFTNWSFQQFCSLPTKDGTLANGEFVSKLSPRLAAEVLNERLGHGVDRKASANLLATRTTHGAVVRRISTDKYEQVFDAVLADRVASLCAKGGWGPAQAFKRAGGNANARHAFGEQPALPLGWVGDRNMFVLLVDYERPIVIGDTTYARFFMLSHSEVGGALDVTFGLLDFVCCNMILWGCTQVFEASFRHTKSIHEKWATLAGGLSKSLAAENEDTIRDGIDAARAYILGDKKEEVIAVARAATDLPKTLIVDAYGRAEATPRYGNPNSAWGMLNGITEASQHVAEHADKRAEIDAKAARLMGLLKR